MLKYLRKRLIGVVIVLIGVTILSFLIANISEVDPAEAYGRLNSALVTDDLIEELRKDMGLDKPIIVQYGNWLLKAVKMDFGQSFMTRNLVVDDLASRFPMTLILVAAALIISVIVVVPIGILCARFKGSWFDNLMHAVTLTGTSFPQFWLGYLLLLLFAVHLKIVPITGYGELNTIFLPACTLALPIISTNIRVLRANILENMNQDYVMYAKARGLSKNRILGKHVLKNAAGPLITIFAQTFGFTIAGTIIVESVFSWPGVGTFAVLAIMSRDLPVINGYIIIMAMIFIVCNLLADLIQISFNPKLLSQEGKM